MRLTNSLPTFLTIEYKVEDYIGKQFRDKIEQLRVLYHPLADDLLAKYGKPDRVED